MIRWNLFFEVEKVEQLALIDRLATHHDRPPSLKASGKRNHDSSISTRPFSTGSVRRGHSAMSARCPVCPKADMAGRLMSTRPGTCFTDEPRNYQRNGMTCPGPYEYPAWLDSNGI